MTGIVSDDGLWIKASASGDGGNCVEQREWTSASTNGLCVEQGVCDDGVHVRDSKNPDTVLRFTKAEYAAWLDGAKRGEFDHLI